MRDPEPEYIAVPVSLRQKVAVPVPQHLSMKDSVSALNQIIKNLF